MVERYSGRHRAEVVTFRLTFPKKLVEEIEQHASDIGFSFTDFVKLLVASYAKFSDLRDRLWKQAERNRKGYYE